MTRQPKAWNPRDQETDYGKDTPMLYKDQEVQPQRRTRRKTSGWESQTIAPQDKSRIKKQEQRCQNPT